MAERLTIARPYAKAVFRLASERQQLPLWSEFLARAAATVADPQLRPLLNHPLVAAEQLIELISAIAGSEPDPQAGNLLRSLSANRRLGYLPEIAAHFERLRAEAERTLDVTVISAVELNPEQRERFAQALRRRLNREVHLHCEIDPALIGGAVIRADDLVIDGSVRAGLTQLAAAAAG
jgi:F-type H+-transporting ATPase subunit delta